jgi:hypothetical protein
MNRILSFLLCLSLAAFPISCAEMSDAQKGAVLGVIAGGIIGGMVGEDEPLLGAAIGVAAGALAGAAIGHYLDKRRRTAQETAKAYDYKPSQGTLVQVENVRLEPSVIKPGESSQLVIEFALLSQDPDRKIPVKETRQIMAQEKTLKEIGPVSKERTSGTYVTEQQVTFPKNLPEATYTFKGVVEAGESSSAKEAKFQIAWIGQGSDRVYALRKTD